MADTERTQDSKHAKYTVSIVETLDEANDVVKRHEESSKEKYVVYVQSKDFGNSNLLEKSHKILWEDDSIEYCSIPFMVLGSKTLDCHYGKDRNLSTKLKRLSADSTVPYKNPNQRRLTKKHGCTAKVVIKEIASFPDYKISSNTKWKRENASKRLRASLSQKTIRGFQRHFVVLVPQVGTHSNHPTDQELQRIETFRMQCQSADGSAKETNNKQKEGDEVKDPSQESSSSDMPANLAICCRELLDEIKSLTFMVEQEKKLMNDLHKNLDMIKHYLITYVQQREIQTQCNNVSKTMEVLAEIERNKIELSHHQQQYKLNNTVQHVPVHVQYENLDLKKPYVVSTAAETMILQPATAGTKDNMESNIGTKNTTKTVKRKCPTEPDSSSGDTKYVKQQFSEVVNAANSEECPSVLDVNNAGSKNLDNDSTSTVVCERTDNTFQLLVQHTASMIENQHGTTNNTSTTTTTTSSGGSIVQTLKDQQPPHAPSPMLFRNIVEVNTNSDHEPHAVHFNVHNYYSTSLTTTLANQNENKK